jgi:hypothetical protein
MSISKDIPKKEISDDGPQLGYDLSRSYGRNWTKTNVHTLFEWLTVAAFNMQCLDYAICLYRSSIRNFTIYGLLVSTLSGTISLSQFGFDQTNVANRVLQGIFTFLTFSLAIYTGYMKIYQIQERLEQYIKLRQDWAIFATTIGSELQLPIELRRDALHLIVKYKATYLDLIKIDIEIPETLRVRAEESLPKSPESSIQVMNLPTTIIQIGIQELDDIQCERQHNKDRYSAGVKIQSGSVDILPVTEAAPAPATTTAPGTAISPKKKLSNESRRDIAPPSVLRANVVLLGTAPPPSTEIIESIHISMDNPPIENSTETTRISIHPRPPPPLEELLEQ